MHFRFGGGQMHYRPLYVLHITLPEEWVDSISDSSKVRLELLFQSSQDHKQL